MKKILFLMTLLVMGISFAFAQTNADIKFDKTTHDFGKFSEVASCGCTVPEYTKEPIMPGKKGTIKVTYNGTGKYPGHFKKSITLRTNAKTEMVRLYIEGDMAAKDAK